MRLSVVMPAFNEQRHIGKTLRALAAQTIGRDAFEVVLVDNGSTDQTIAIAQQFAEVLQLKIITKLGGNIASVRNTGGEAATGDVLVFLDADCTVRPDWLEKALTQRPANSLWGAHYLPPPDASWVGAVWGRCQAKPQAGPVAFLPSCNIFIGRDDFARIGRFNEAQDTSEDVELSARARNHGMDIVAIPSIAVVHEGTPETLKQFYKQNYWHGKHVLRMFLARLPSLTNLPLIVLSAYVLMGLIALPILTLWAAIAGHPFLALIPCIWIVLPAIVLALLKSAQAQRVMDAPALFVLYMTYLVARALSLVSNPVRSHR